jgi:elongation factor P
MAGDFRKGITFQLDTHVMVIVDFQHVKPGKGAAFVRAKIKNVMTGGVIERTFNPSEKYELATIERKEMQYSYNSDNLYYFMDKDTYDLVPIGHELMEDALPYLKENENAVVCFFNGSPFSVEPPNFVDLLITFCEPGVRGDTATNTLKPATMETGLIVHVPMFINEGEVIKVDTRTGEYYSRA